MSDPSPAHPEPGSARAPGDRPAGRVRRRRLLRLGGWAAATVVVVVVLGLLWRGSDAAATTSTTAPEPAPATGTPADQLAEAWSAGPTGPAPRRVVESGRVVLALADGVRALDPATGDEAWRYTRSNARLCDVTAVDGSVVAVFSTGGRCNEIVALDAGTGVRVWYRTVGFRADVALASTERIVLASSPTGLATLDPTGNNTRWRYEVPAGCRLTGADVGSTGVVALQVCDGDPVQALFFDGFDGSQTWTRDLGAVTARLVGVDRLVDVVTGDTLQVLSPADGTPLQTLTLPPAPGPDAGPLQQAGLDDAALVWVRGTLSVLDQATGALRWSVPASGLPAVSDGGKTTEGAVLVPEDGAMVSRDLRTGTELARSTVPAGVPVGGRTSVVGGTVVVATPEEVVAYS